MGLWSKIKDLASTDVGDATKGAARKVDEVTDTYIPTFKKAPAAAMAIAGGLRSGASATIYHLRANHTVVFLVIVALVHAMHVPFRGTPVYGPSDPLFTVYIILLPLLAAMLFYRDPDGPPIPLKPIAGFMILGAVSYYIPVLLNYAVAHFAASRTIAALLLVAAPGWVIYTFLNPGDSSITRVLGGIFFFAWIVTIMVVIFSTQLDAAKDISAPQVITMSTFKEASAEALARLKGTVVDAPKQALVNTQQFFRGQIANATDPQYTGTVDQTEGQPIGVYITEAQALNQKYDTQYDDVVVLAIMKARTFSDSITIRNRCYLTYVDALTSTATEKKDGAVYPETITVDFTGTFQDKFDLECTVKQEDIQDVQGRFVSATAHFNSTFDFETLGYATYSFMDRDLMSAFRLESTDPATVLGVPRTLQAKYTPGPIQIGMPQDTMPIAYDNASQNLPIFGVTLTNAWFGKGGVDAFERIEFAVPEPFYLDTLQDCVGGKAGKISIRETGRNPDNRRYMRYEVANPQTLEPQTGQNFVTIRCRMRVDPDSDYSVLGTAGAGIYTFSVSTRYRYTLETRAPVTLQGPGAGISCITDTMKCEPTGACTCRAQDSYGYPYSCSWSTGQAKQCVVVQ